MGYPTSSRAKPVYPPKMPILEALVTLGYAAAVTERIGLGTEVLVLPQRQPVLVAKQVATLDILSGGAHEAGGRRRLAGSGIRGTGGGFRQSRSAHERRHRHPARLLVGRADRF